MFLPSEESQISQNDRALDTVYCAAQCTQSALTQCRLQKLCNKIVTFPLPSSLSEQLLTLNNTII